MRGMDPFLNLVQLGKSPSNLASPPSHCAQSDGPGFLGADAGGNPELFGSTQEPPTPPLSHQHGRGTAHANEKHQFNIGQPRARPGGPGQPTTLRRQKGPKFPESRRVSGQSAASPPETSILGADSGTDPG